mmetsp:Transcript_4226/g.7526  ORF Transcript_4226/g.7526 Transcript_4226/m.7526 type:complete len:119 (+) Transcript_4226:77-433(+)
MPFLFFIYKPLVFSFVVIVLFSSKVMRHSSFSIKDLLKMNSAFKTVGVRVEKAALAISDRVSWIPAWNYHHCCPDCVVEAYFLDGYCHLDFGANGYHVIPGLIFDWRADRLVISCQPC